MRKVILIGGKAGSGKNTVANLMKEHLEAKGKKVLILGNGDKVREYAKKYFNLVDYKASSEGRRIMLGITDMMYDLYPNYYDKITEKTIMEANDVDVFIITDWRYACTYEYLQQNDFLELTAIYLKREGKYKYTKEITQNKSETGVELRPYVDYFIYNNNATLDTLRQCVVQYLEVLFNV